ncbi:hypothetical protein [Flavobacterium sp.]|uniref:hypothetical protein n=1 Tax=Flavobacterium sp. TaxID=239 RepID=UPI0028BED8D8|nr:hypothetical protein [Flavobacterium sp.]
MKKLKRVFVLFGIVLVLQSCQNDPVEIQNSDVVITGYQIVNESEYTGEGGAHTATAITTAVLNNNKLQSLNLEVFADGSTVSTDVTFTQFNYQNDLLISRIKTGTSGVLEETYFYYDSNSRLVGGKIALYGAEDFGYWRFVYQSENQVLVQRGNAMYDDPTAEFYTKVIVNFDENDNIESYQRVDEISGIYDSLVSNVFVNDNLVSSSYNGVNSSFQYSPIVNNMNYIEERTYGKRSLMLINAPGFGTMDSENNVAFTNPKNLSFVQGNEATYTIGSNGFILSQVSTTDEYDVTSVKTITYYFE